MCSRRATRQRAGQPCCCCTAFPSSPIAGARCCRRWRRRAITRSRPTSAATAAPPAGTPTIDGDLASFRFTNLLRDAIGVLFALGHRTAEAVVGHDFGAAVAAYARAGAARHLQAHGADERARSADRPPCRSTRPTSRRPPRPRHPCRAGSPAAAAQALPMVLLDAAGQRRTCGRRGRACTISCAPTTITRAPTGKPTSRSSSKGWTAEELAKMPTYYIMDLADGMAETVAKEMPSAAEIAANTWLPDARAQGL